MASSLEEVPVAGESVVCFKYTLANDLVDELIRRVPAFMYCLVADENVYAIYGEEFVSKFRATGKTLFVKVVPSGETTKDRKVKEEIEDFMLQNKFNRDSCCIALGGGVVGDLTGYVASTYMRGVPFVQVPTTLLAMVDASVGGKTAINTPMGKNLIGAFHQPTVVFMDMAFLDGFSRRDPARAEREFRAGIAEIIKTGAIWDKSLFEVCEQKVDQIQAREHVVLNEIVKRSVQIKAEVVTLDPKEGGLRGILNWGHTIGHAIEGLCGMADYSDGLLHGECVAIGMVLESNLARALGLMTPAMVGRVVRCIEAYKLPTKMPPQLHIDKIMAKMMGDKKNIGGKLKCVLLDNIGHCYEPKASSVDAEMVRMICSPCITPVPTGPLSGSVRVPGSKSVSNRVLPMAVLGKGECRIRGLLTSDDTQRCMEALTLLHEEGEAAFEWVDNGNELVVKGSGGRLRVPSQELYLGNSGTSARFLTGVSTVVDKAGGKIVVTGNNRMKVRPIKDMVDAFEKHGCKIKYLEGQGCPPIEIETNGLAAGTLEMSAQISSQYVSGVLIAAPLAKGPVALQLLEDKAISEPYIEMTVGMMKQFGVNVTKPKSNRYEIGNTGYTNPATYEVEADASAATYPLAIAGITGGKVTCEAVGTGSTQGDAKFCFLLEAMGCTVTQGGDSTTVQGPPAGGLKGLGTFDMESMTDAFMTAAVLAAVANGKTRITGVANQRVKECNRIQVMQTELTKCGVKCSETEDGIEIEGAGGVGGLRGAVIHCHDDHRIAMSFAVLGCVLPGLIITEKECVEKTYPEFWDHLRSKLGATLHPATSHPEEEGGAGGVKSPHVILIGMRGAGKTTMGKELARRMKRGFVDLDDAAVASIGGDIGGFVKAQGWPAFRTLEAKLLGEVLESGGGEGKVVSCGGGIVETEESRRLLAAAKRSGHVVVHVRRNFGEIEAYLTGDPSRPALPEPPSVVWARRESLYTESCSLEFLCVSGSDEATMEDDHAHLLLLVDRAVRRSRTAVVRGTVTISLTHSDMREAARDAAKLEKGADALEMRVDLLGERSEEELRQQHSLLRRASSLPIIWTVRSKPQGGKFEGSEGEYVKLLRLGVRLGCEFVDVESCWSGGAKASVLKSKGISVAIASYHDFAENFYDAPAILKILEKLREGGSADVVKMAIKTPKPSQVSEMDYALTKFMDKHKMPAVGLCMGAAGKQSRVTNNFLTFSTHPLMPGAAAPGQLFSSEVKRLRQELGLTPAVRTFFLFGSPIAKSASPAMHNAAFKDLGIGGWTYDRCETTDIKAALEVINREEFGGGSVTMPLKEDVMPHMHELSDSARRIAAVNTIIVRNLADGTRVLVGDNTDWVAVRNLVEEKVCSRRLRTGQDCTAILVGAGGTAKAAMYALCKTKGVKKPILIYNRTASRGQALADEFGAKSVSSLEGLSGVGVIVSTIPPEGHEAIPDSLLAGNPIMLDASYMPGGAPLTKRAEAAGCDVIVGPHMLFEQATYQSERWTGRAAPRGAMAAAAARHFGPDSGLSTVLAHEMHGL